MSEIISVAELNSRVKQLFSQSKQINDIWVSGEISGLKKYPSGYYFTLKDAASEIRAVMFNSARARIDFEPKENMKVAVFGSIDLYVQRGSYQFMVQSMRQDGIGDRYVAFEKLKRKLAEEGLFEQSIKRPLPKYPRRIGVVTSASGAVIHDIITTSESRFTADIYLAPAQVQGEGAADTIVAGIRLLNRFGVDVIIVGRGGGSIEDLWPFNEEKVARAIRASGVPVVSAVGHETDFTIADFVADVRAPTPTGAAAIILRDKAEIRSEIDGHMVRADKAMLAVLDRMRHSFETLDAKLAPGKALDSLGMRRMELDDYTRRMDACLRDKVRDMRAEFGLLDQRLRPEAFLDEMDSYSKDIDVRLDRIRVNAERVLERSSAGLAALEGRPTDLANNIFNGCRTALDNRSDRLEAVNPMNVLDRGYSMITSEDGEVITSKDRTAVGQDVVIRFRDGSVPATITDKELE